MQNDNPSALTTKRDPIPIIEPDWFKRPPRPEPSEPIRIGGGGMVAMVGIIGGGIAGIVHV